MPFEFNQLFRVSRTKMEKPEPGCGTRSRRENRDKTQHHGTGREAGLSSAPSHCRRVLPEPVALPQNSRSGILPSCPQGRSDHEDRRLCLQEDFGFPLRTYLSWGSPRLCLFVWYREPILVFYGIKSILPVAFFCSSMYFHWILSPVQAVLGTLGSERSKDSLCPPGPPARRARHRVHKQPRGISELSGPLALELSWVFRQRIHNLLRSINLSDTF